MSEGRIRRISAALALALILGLGAAPAPDGAQAAASYEVDLYRPGDFVSQTNLVQCVGASMQMMINMMASQDDRTGTTQRELWLLARSFRTIPNPNRQRKGASVWGWSKGLDSLGYGSYRVVGYDTIEEATAAAARAISLSGKPVGLLVWAGRHAWVMSGFRATADPVQTDNYRVTHAYVLDPLYPLHSTTWGRSPEPNSRLSLDALGNYFVPRRRGRSGLMAGKYVLVMPVDAAKPRPSTQALPI